MKTKWVATLIASTSKVLFQSGKNLGRVFLMSLVFLIISCDKSDDFETISNDPPPDNESPNIDSFIVYTDIDPDFKSENLNDSYNLDLNNDQIIDFTVSSDSYESWDWLGIASNPNVENGIISTTPWYSHPVPLNIGKEIFNLRGYSNGESFQTWGVFTVGDCFGGEQGCIYDWKNKVDMYLGLRFNLKGRIHYGWARLDVASVTQWVIKDYAYNATPNMPILAGQTNK